MKILAIGASARSAAQSIQQAKHQVVALDLFVDRDLSEIAHCAAIREFPESIVEQAASWPDSSILLCGGMENYPEVVAELEKTHPIIGPNSKQILALRELENLARWVDAAEDNDWLRFPESSFPKERKTSVIDIEPSADDGAAVPPFDQRLWKPVRGSAGMRIKKLTVNEPVDFSLGYAQRFISGPVLGITFLCRPGSTCILGAMRNVTLSDLVPVSFEHEIHSPFQYAGSMGPIDLKHHVAARLEQWVDKTAQSIEYCGLLQADFIVGNDGFLYLLEFNPRWTASMELIEFSTGLNLVQEQIDAQFGSSRSPIRFPASNSTNRHAQWMKRILYASQRQTISKETSDAMMQRSTSRWNSSNELSTEVTNNVGWADIPNADTQIDSGTPIATILAKQTRNRSSDARHSMAPNANDMLAWPEIDEIIDTIPRSLAL
ncbi:MAG: ATP-grasp domain-containing protein [Pirellulaceae bacterium]|nr:ATP-grasp domain-containing protein [Pirellulaceae bacterium]